MWRASLAALLLTAAGCESSQGSGELAEEVRGVASFRRVQANGARVEVSSGAGQGVAVRGDDNLVGRVTTAVVEGELRVSQDEGIFPRLPLMVVVSVPILEAVFAEGRSELSVCGIKADEFGVTAAGGSSVALSGEAKALAVDAAGGALVDARELAAAVVRVKARGGALVYVRRTADLQIDADEGAVVEAVGEPVVVAGAAADAPVPVP